jgi:hypothetical protein
MTKCPNKIEDLHHIGKKKYCHDTEFILSWKNIGTTASGFTKSDSPSSSVVGRSSMAGGMVAFSALRHVTV